MVVDVEVLISPLLAESTKRPILSPELALPIQQIFVRTIGNPSRVSSLKI